MKKKKGDDLGEITSEMLEKLKIEIMLKEDELSAMTEHTLREGGKLNDPDLSELSLEAEEYALYVDMLEERVRQLEERENDVKHKDEDDK